jgi:hypothetical protein
MSRRVGEHKKTVIAIERACLEYEADFLFGDFVVTKGRGVNIFLKGRVSVFFTEQSADQQWASRGRNNFDRLSLNCWHCLKEAG